MKIVYTEKNITINCVFGESTDFQPAWIGEYFYYCHSSNKFINQTNSEVIEISGRHISGKFNKDVTLFYLPSSPTIYRFPSKLFIYFPNLKGIYVYGCEINSIDNMTFKGLNKIENIYLAVNKIQFVASNTFVEMEKLLKLEMQDNLIAILESDLFENNKNLKYIDFRNNKIKFIDAEILKNLPNLDEVYLMGTICLNKNYKGIKEIKLQLNVLIQSKQLFQLK